MQANALSTSTRRVDLIAVEVESIMNACCFNECLKLPGKDNRVAGKKQPPKRGLARRSESYSTHPIGLDSFTCFKAGLQRASEG